MRVHVAFTPDEQAAAPTGVVIDAIRATSTIAQALDAGYEEVLCAAEVDDARALARVQLVFHAVDEELVLVLALRPDGNIGKARYLIRRQLPGIRAAL